MNPDMGCSVRIKNMGAVDFQNRDCNGIKQDSKCYGKLPHFIHCTRDGWSLCTLVAAFYGRASGNNGFPKASMAQRASNWYAVKIRIWGFSG